ncbi:hypothetical protein [Terasakiella pusilla]|uniref:hypothetical protein n=1 Tax=Terasakiella pusilla TaxID=64973 RepID=UPI003AA8C248
MSDKSYSFTPSYLRKDEEAIKVSTLEVVSFLKDINKNAFNRIEKCLNKPESGLVPLLCEHLYDEENNTYFPLAHRDNVQSRNHEVTRTIFQQAETPEDIYEQAPSLFANALTIPDLIDVDIDGHHTYGPSPTERITNCGLLVHTIEFDAPASDQKQAQEFLATQIGWAMGKKSALHQIYNDLIKYRDFRGIEMVWSGNKSCHLHFLFDIRHLAATRFAVRKEDEPWGYHPDLTDSHLYEGMKQAWSLVTKIVKTQLRIDFVPDATLQSPVQYRRFPWGRRRLGKGNILNAPEGIIVPQIPLWCKFREYPCKQDQNWLHDPVRFLEIHRESSFKPKHSYNRKPTLALSSDDHVIFIRHLARYCERQWGDPQHHPRPAFVEAHSDGYRIAFYNNHSDKTPSSVMIGNHNRLLVNMSNVDKNGTEYRLPNSANGLVNHFIEHGHLLFMGSKNDQARNYLERKFFNQVWDDENAQPIATAMEIQQEILPELFVSAAQSNKKTLLFSGEGIGKTTSLIKALPYLDEMDGHLMIACKSYAQAIEKCDALNDMISGNQPYLGAVVYSFSSLYQSYCMDHDEEPMSEEERIRIGTTSQCEAVYMRGGECVDFLEEYKRDFWAEFEMEEQTVHTHTFKPKKRPVLFVAQATAQNWHVEGGTRLWLHPQYREYIGLKKTGSPLADDVKKKIYDDLSLQWLVHDEVSTNHLYNVESQASVIWCQSVRNKYAGWNQKRTSEKFSIFTVEKAQWPIPPSEKTFSKFIDILTWSPNNEDLYEIDPASEPIGFQNSPDSPYLAVKGKQFYIRETDWWKKGNHRLTLLTTEHRVKAFIDTIRSRYSDEPSNDTFQIFNADCHYVLDTSDIRLDLYLDSRARAPQTGREDIRNLAHDIQNQWPQVQIISDTLRDLATTHETAKGSNLFTGPDKTTTAIYLFPSPDQYANLLLENAYLKRCDMVKLSYLDQFNQTCGRTLGFRYSEGSVTLASMSPTLWKEIGTTLCGRSRYRINLHNGMPTPAMSL